MNRSMGDFKGFNIDTIYTDKDCDESHHRCHS